MNYLERIRAIEKLEKEAPEVPWKVWTAFFECEPNVGFFSNQVMMGTGDPKSVEEMREAIEWFADQFGGKVKWKK